MIQRVSWIEFTEISKSGLYFCFYSDHYTHEDIEYCIYIYTISRSFEKIKCLDIDWKEAKQNQKLNKTQKRDVFLVVNGDEILRKNCPDSEGLISVFGYACVRLTTKNGYLEAKSKRKFSLESNSNIYSTLKRPLKSPSKFNPSSPKIKKDLLHEDENESLPLKYEYPKNNVNTSLTSPFLKYLLVKDNWENDLPLMFKYHSKSVKENQETEFRVCNLFQKAQKYFSCGRYIKRQRFGSTSSYSSNSSENTVKSRILKYTPKRNIILKKPNI